MKTKIFKRYVMDENASWEQRWRQLQAHHYEETRFLIARIEELETSMVCAVCGATTSCAPCLRTENERLKVRVTILKDQVKRFDELTCCGEPQRGTG